VDVAVVPAAVLTDRHREVAEPDAAQGVAVLVAPDRGWVDRLEFKTRLQRWRRSTIEPHVEVAERSAVPGCTAQDIPVLPHVRPSSAAAGRETRCRHARRAVLTPPSSRRRCDGTSQRPPTAGACRCRAGAPEMAKVPRSTVENQRGNAEIVGGARKPLGGSFWHQ
jgi:hypothetical protein